MGGNRLQSLDVTHAYPYVFISSMNHKCLCSLLAECAPWGEKKKKILVWFGRRSVSRESLSLDFDKKINKKKKICRGSCRKVKNVFVFFNLKLTLGK